MYLFIFFSDSESWCFGSLSSYVTTLDASVTAGSQGGLQHLFTLINADKHATKKCRDQAQRLASKSGQNSWFHQLLQDLQVLKQQSSPTPSHDHHYIWLLVLWCSYEMGVMRNANLSVHRIFSQNWRCALANMRRALVFVLTPLLRLHCCTTMLLPHLWQQVHILSERTDKKDLLKNVFMLGFKYRLSKCACAACLRVFCCFFTFTSLSIDKEPYLELEEYLFYEGHSK